MNAVQTLNTIHKKIFLKRKGAGKRAQAAGAAPDMGGFNPDMGNAGGAANNDGNVYDADFTDVN